MIRDFPKLELIITRLGLRKFVKHHIWPFLVQRRQAAYNAKRYFDSWYRSSLDDGFSDRITISPDASRLDSRYHYNAIENSVIEYLSFKQLPPALHVLDIGSGAGHWVDFYLDVFQAVQVVGIEISGLCAELLRQKYKGQSNVRIIEANISDRELSLGCSFDIINAVGVMFHIVEDELWKQAVKNFANHINEDGVIIIGGQFGMVTRNIQFHGTDEFVSKKEAGSYTDPEVALVDKRIRSLGYWRRCVKQAGLRVECIRKTKQSRTIITPENNILALAREKH